MSQREFVAPFFKGLIDNKDRMAWSVMMKRDCTTGQPIEDQAYLELVEACKGMVPELIQNVARAASGALLAQNKRDANETRRLISIEGCMQRVGDEMLTGSQVMQKIWENVVPDEIMRDVPPPIVENISYCTVAEVRGILKYIGDSGILHAVTHSYHKPRVEDVFREEMNTKPGGHCIAVWTPEDVVQLSDIRHPYEHFVRDLVMRSMPPNHEVKREMRLEKWMYRPLHTLSRVGEVLTRGRFNLEQRLASRLRLRDNSM